MGKDKYINFEDGCTSLNFPKPGEGPHVSSSGYALRKGQKNALTYTEDQLIEMLGSGNIEDIYEAFGAIGKIKLKKALPNLQTTALYDEDLSLQIEAIRTIRKIGGRKAFEVLRFLKQTEHKEFVQEMLDLRNIEDIDAC